MMMMMMNMIMYWYMTILCDDIIHDWLILINMISKWRSYNIACMINSCAVTISSCCEGFNVGRRQQKSFQLTVQGGCQCVLLQSAPYSWHVWDEAQLSEPIFSMCGMIFGTMVYGDLCIWLTMRRRKTFIQACDFWIILYIIVIHSGVALLTDIPRTWPTCK